MSDVIERFRYRFQLWRRERGSDWRGPEGNRVKTFESPPHSEPRAKPDYVSVYLEHRRGMNVLRESTFKAIVRLVGIYLFVILILWLIYVILGGFIPSARFALGVILVVIAGIWTLMMILGGLWFRDARRQDRQRREAIKSSNQSMDRTTDR